MRKHLYWTTLVLLPSFLAFCKGSSPTGSTPPVVKNPPVINTFSAYPNPIYYKQATKLSWDVSGATSVEITPTIGSVSSSGEKSVTLESTQTFTLTAKNADGTSQKDLRVDVKPGAYFEIISTTKKYKSYGCCYLDGVAKNTGTGTGYNVGIDFQAYNSSNTIIDTAHGFPADLGNIPPGVSAVFEAIFFNTYDWNKIARIEYSITWLNVTTGLRITQKGIVDVPSEMFPDTPRMFNP